MVSIRYPRNPQILLCMNMSLPLKDQIHLTLNETLNFSY